ncbi:MAG: hypothetical protein H6748_20805 [Spirochaetaceae bacterium]|nr:hypothetical protein [Myxococcales bacterium]MCB9726502.1 hypothetical protein [Spirochaetaceae bacterium]HPG25434.1 hypothetical protein [Myxococcota bacterium]
MAFGERGTVSGGTPFEVRCPSCRVTFPVETKRCVHCGGPTTRPVPIGAEESLRVAPIEIESDIRLRKGSSLGKSLSQTIHGPGPNERELEVEDAPPSFVRGLLNSLGGMIWVIAFVVFTIVRQCNGGE